MPASPRPVARPSRLHSLSALALVAALGILSCRLITPRQDAGDGTGSRRSRDIVGTQVAYRLGLDDGTVSDVRFVYLGRQYPVVLPCDWGRRQVDNDLWAHGFQSLRWLQPILRRYQVNHRPATAAALRAYLADFHRYHYREQRAADRLFYGDHTLAIRLRLLVAVAVTFRADGTAVDSTFTANVLLPMIRDHVRLALDDPRLVHPDHVNNHQVMLNAAVVDACLALPEIDPAGERRALAEKRLRRLVDHLFTPSGIATEQSLSYQIYDMGVLMDIRSIYTDRGATLPPRIERLLHQGQEILAYSLLPDRTLPGIGDTFIPYSLRRLRYLDKMLGGLSADLSGALAGTGRLSHRAVIWPDAGMAVMRPVGGGGPAILFFMASWFSNAHKHADDLSFTFYSRGRRIIDDMAYSDVLTGGRDRYSLWLKNYCRSAGVHNVITAAAHPWRTDHPGTTRLTAWGAGPGWLAVQGEHHRIPGTTVTRTVILLGTDTVLIQDHIVTSLTDTFTQRFMLDPGLTVAPCDDGLALAADDGALHGRLVGFADDGAPVPWRIQRGRDRDHPPYVLRRRKIVPTTVVSRSVHGSGELVLRTALAVAPAGSTAVTPLAFRETAPGLFTVRLPGEATPRRLALAPCDTVSPLRVPHAAPTAAATALPAAGDTVRTPPLPPAILAPRLAAAPPDSYLLALAPRNNLAARRRHADALVERGDWSLNKRPAVSLGFPPDWRADPYHSRSWCWALHAFNWLDDLLAAGAATGDTLYLGAALRLAASWREQALGPDPAPFAWHDHATALRAERLLALWERTRRSPAFAAHRAPLLALLREHGRRLAGRALYSPHTNHGFTQARVLVLLALALPELPEAPAWLETGERRLRDEIAYAFTPDGVHRENSPAYHLHMLQELQRVSDLYAAYGRSCPEATATLARALPFAAWILLPDGTLPAIGDTSPIAYRRPPVPASLPDRDHVLYAWTAGREGAPFPTTDLVLPESGYAIWRDRWPPATAYGDAVMVVVKASALSRYHWHDDVGSCVLYGHGRRWLVDAGLFAYQYDDPRRRFVTSRRAHNVVTVDDTLAGGPKRVVPSRLVAHGEDGRVSWCVVRDSLAGGIVAWRRLRYERPDRLTVCDSLVAPPDSAHTWRQLFHLAPGLAVQRMEDGFLAGVPGGDGWRLRITGGGDGATPYHVEGQEEPFLQGWVSDRPGHVTPAPVVGWTARGDHAVFRTVLELLPPGGDGD